MIVSQTYLYHRCHYVIEVRIIIIEVSIINAEVKSVVLSLFLELVLLTCLGTCSSVPVHIHTYQSRAR